MCTLTQHTQTLTQPRMMSVAAFLTDPVSVVGVATQTADSYLSHLIKRAVTTRCLKNAKDVRTAYNRGHCAAWAEAEVR